MRLGLKFVPSSTNSRFVFLPLSQTLSHRICPVLVTNSFKTYFSDSIQTNCMFTCFSLCNGHVFVLRKTHVLPASASILSLGNCSCCLAKRWSLYEGGHYKENYVIKNSDFFIPYFGILNYSTFRELHFDYRFQMRKLVSSQ